MALGSGTALGQPVSEGAWEPARWEQAILDAKQARERGKLSEAEQLCVVALRYVDASAARSLDEYATLLHELKRDQADAARTRADKFRESKTQSGSVYLGWIPSSELRAYAGLLQELKRGPEAGAMQALADAYETVQRAHFARLQAQARGRDPRGICPSR